MRCKNPWGDKRKEGIAEDCFGVYEEKGYFVNITYYNKHNKKEKREKRKIGEGVKVGVCWGESALRIYILNRVYVAISLWEKQG